MKVCLIHLPFRHHKFSENLKVVDEEFILAPPIILAYVASIIRKAGHEVKIIDAHTLRMTKERIIEEIKKFSPDFLGFRIDTYNSQDHIRIINYLKKKTGIPVIAGGINFSLYPYETMKHSLIDFGFIGEAIETLPQFLESYPSGDYRKIKGLCYRDKSGEIIINPADKRLVNFDDYPFPARDLLPNELYHSFVSQKKNFTIMLTSTGCPYKCKFCAIAGLNNYRERSPESVVSEIEECYYKYGVREIDFFDATFFINKERTFKICESLLKKKLDISWTCRSRVDVVNREILEIAKRAGLRMVFWGIESGSDEILGNINKKIDVEITKKTVEMSRKLGIRNLGFLMIGNPGENEKDVKKTLQLAKKLKLDYVQICRTIPKPGSALHNEIVRKTKYDYWKEFVSGKEKERRIYVYGRKMSEEKIEKLLKFSYYSFYFRIGYIFYIITKIHSFEELFRYIRVALRMLFHYFYTDVGVTKKSHFVKKAAHLWKVKI